MSGASRPILSLQAVLVLSLAFMGLLALAVALLTGRVYHDLTIQNMRDALVNLVALETREALNRVEGHAFDLGLAVQAEPRLLAAYHSGGPDGLSDLLDQQFRQYFVTAEVLPLLLLRAYSTEFRPLAQSTAGDLHTALTEPVCPALLQAARSRQGTARFQLIGDVCRSEGRAVHAALVPVGGLRLAGYLLVVSDPIPELEGLARDLGMGLNIQLPERRVLFRSMDWPERSEQGTRMNATFVLSSALAPADGPVLRISVATDTSRLDERLTETGYAVLIAVVTVTVLAVLLAFFLLRKTALQPLRHLIRRLQTESAVQRHEPGARTGGRLLAVREVDMLQQIYEAVEHLAFNDHLTALPNRMRFAECLERMTAENRRQGDAFAVFVMDLDRFKAVNDSCGHSAGDEVLREVGQRLRAALRNDDLFAIPEQEWHGDNLLARLGGDEFAAIVRGVACSEQVEIVAERLLAAMQLPFELCGESFTVGLSIGVALFPAHGTNPAALVCRADAAMYQAKLDGARWRIFDDRSGKQGRCPGFLQAPVTVLEETA